MSEGKKVYVKTRTNDYLTLTYPDNVAMANQLIGLAGRQTTFRWLSVLNSPVAFTLRFNQIGNDPINIAANQLLFIEHDFKDISIVHAGGGGGLANIEIMIGWAREDINVPDSMD